MAKLKSAGYVLISFLVIFFFVLFLAPHSYAETLVSDSQQNSQMPPSMKDGQGQSGQQARKALPQEAIDACAGKSEGSVCQCGGPQGSGTGTCGWTPDKKYFACKPSRMPQGGQGSGGPGGQNSGGPDGQTPPAKPDQGQ
jgi:hypothetical protein